MLALDAAAAAKPALSSLHGLTHEAGNLKPYISPIAIAPKLSPNPQSLKYLNVERYKVATNLQGSWSPKRFLGFAIAGLGFLVGGLRTGVLLGVGRGDLPALPGAISTSLGEVAMNVATRLLESFFGVDWAVASEGLVDPPSAACCSSPNSAFAFAGTTVSGLATTVPWRIHPHSALEDGTVKYARP